VSLPADEAEHSVRVLRLKTGAPVGIFDGRGGGYTGLAYGRRGMLHARAGLRMERDYGATLDEVGGLLSLHFHRAGDRERTWRYARQAAGRARDNAAFSAAA